jgi:hypothetical protein
VSLELLLLRTSGHEKTGKVFIGKIPMIGT